MSNKAYTQDGKKKKNIMRRFKLDEISAVDRPAQEGALMMIMKRDEGLHHKDEVGTVIDKEANWKKLNIPLEEAEKALADMLTSSDEGHQHGVKIEHYDGETYIYISHAAGPDGQDHNHEVVVENGEFKISENVGHDHSLDADMVQRALMSMMIERKRAPEKSEPSAEPIGKTQPKKDDDMAEDSAGNTAEIEKRDDQIKKQNDVIARLESVVNLSPEQRAHYDSLPAEKRDDFLTLPDGEKDTLIAKKDEANPVVFKASDGTEFRKSDDPRMVEMAKRFDEQTQELAKARVDAEQAVFLKKAQTDLKLLPGEEVHKVSLLRAISKIDDKDVRDAVEDIVIKASKVFDLALQTRGQTADTPIDRQSAEQLMTKRVKEIAAEKGLPEHKAQEEFLGTAEGNALYKAYQAERFSKMAKN